MTQQRDAIEGSTNRFGNVEDLSNESTVEQFFVIRLLADLGYPDAAIRPKASLAELSVSSGRRSDRWRPDYGLEVGREVRWIIEVKGVDEDLDDWVGQAASYCFELNKAARRANRIGCEYFLLTNGVSTRLYKWDEDEPLVTASFHDFQDRNFSYDALRDAVSFDALSRRPQAVQRTNLHYLHRLPVPELNAHFAWAHRTIYRRENLSYTAAFMEFVKVIFLKLWSDRRAHAAVTARILPNGTLEVAAEEVLFSRRWIESREAESSNPLDLILFQERIREFEAEIITGRKKRIFGQGEHIELSAETLKALAVRLESIDLISLDADLNGRMFETFLNSTLRGKDLGQYFTPRSVVKLATGLASLRATRTHIDRVLDACCGTGGFLIEALADMWDKIDANSAYSSVEREELKRSVANTAVVGVDVARDPALARIARINMYLHGDGGSSIFQLDSLDKHVRHVETDSVELRGEKDAFRALVAAGDRFEEGRRRGIADVVLTNPPFAKEYDRAQPSDDELLNEYELGFAQISGTRRPVARVSSMVLFFERYYDLLADGGRLVSIVDDGILGGRNHERLRDWMRRKWIIEAVVSLPGDAFQRSQARVKTSVLVMRKKIRADEEQPDVFMYYCSAVGVDDSPRARVLPIDGINRAAARDEIDTVTDLFQRFQEGTLSNSDWVVPAAAIANRMDVKAVMPQLDQRELGWIKAGFDPIPVGTLLTNALSAADTTNIERTVTTESVEGELTYLRVRYDGFCEAGDTVAAGDLKGGPFTRVRAGDLVISNINAINGAIGVVPEHLDGLIVTSEFTVCVPTGDLDTHLIWAMLRSAETRADMLLRSTGIGRTRVNWAIIQELRIPRPPEAVAERILSALRQADHAEHEAEQLRTAAAKTVAQDLRLDTPLAGSIISAFKPPR